MLQLKTYGGFLTKSTSGMLQIFGAPQRQPLQDD